MDKRWPIVGITILMIVLIYNFLTMIFRSDQKRFSHDRIYVDYSDYRHGSKPSKTGAGSTSAPSHPQAKTPHRQIMYFCKVR